MEAKLKKISKNIVTFITLFCSISAIAEVSDEFNNTEKLLKAIEVKIGIIRDIPELSSQINYRLLNRQLDLNKDNELELEKIKSELEAVIGREANSTVCIC
ncbi:MAG: hypothetical protein ACJAS4_000864 [Bacteriovoracaceae bacterium]|jgi:hypothetical protein